MSCVNSFVNAFIRQIGRNVANDVYYTYDKSVPTSDISKLGMISSKDKQCILVVDFTTTNPSLSTTKVIIYAIITILSGWLLPFTLWFFKNRIDSKNDINEYIFGNEYINDVYKLDRRYSSNYRHLGKESAIKYTTYTRNDISNVDILCINGKEISGSDFINKIDSERHEEVKRIKNTYFKIVGGYYLTIILIIVFAMFLSMFIN